MTQACLNVYMKTWIWEICIWHCTNVDCFPRLGMYSTVSPGVWWFLNTVQSGNTCFFVMSVTIVSDC